MCLLIYYQQATGSFLRGPAIFVRASFEKFCPSGLLAVCPGWLRAGRSGAMTSPEAPPTPSYRGVMAHTDVDFGLIRDEKSRVNPGQSGRGRGNDVQNGLRLTNRGVLMIFGDQGAG